LWRDICDLNSENSEIERFCFDLKQWRRKLIHLLLVLGSLWLGAAYWINGAATDEVIALSAIPVAYIVTVMLLRTRSQ
jgi:hypothetical protein